MSVYCCLICDQNPKDKARFMDTGLADGDICPICHRPICRHHMVTVRWKWRGSTDQGVALICKECHRAYRHRSWDTAYRDWIT